MCSILDDLDWDLRWVVRHFQEIHVLFHPYFGKISNLTNIFQMGWNHQPDVHDHFFRWGPTGGIFQYHLTFLFPSRRRKLPSRKLDKICRPWKGTISKRKSSSNELVFQGQAVVSFRGTNFSLQVPFMMLWMRASDILMMRKLMVDRIWWVKCFMTGWPRQGFLERIG